MKKVLLGLVIALMMTSSGYASNMISQGTETCPKLFNKLLVLSKKFEDDVNFENYLNKELSNTNIQNRAIKEASLKNQKKRIDDRVKLMHYYAVTWSALCD